MHIREAILSSLQAALRSVGVEDPAPILEHPSEISHGDYATSAALQYAKALGIAPRALAEQITAAIGSIDGVDSITIAGPGFINFTLASKAIADSIRTAQETDMWGANGSLSGRKIMVEYTQPNPFKEFHIGHLMSNAVGESVSRLVQFSGAEVRRANYQGDVGPHVAKAIWGIQKLALDPSSAASLGTAYVAGNTAYESDENVKAQIDAINAKVYDHSDPLIDDLYTKGRAASLEHFEHIYAVLGTKFDHYFFESQTAHKGLALVRAHMDVFAQSDGAIVYEGESDGLHTRVFITSKGLPTYETKELGLAEMKAETWNFDTSITVTASEQKEYFKVVQAVLRKIMPDIAAKIMHITHGMMRFADGKMSSRTGNVITGESLIVDLTEAAKERAAESRAESQETLAEQVAVAAIKYQILRQSSHKDIVFDRDRALSLEGDSGPYLQYAHARAHQIVEKAAREGVAQQIDPSIAPNDVARLLHRFPEIVEYAARLYEPHILTTHLTEIAGAFNSWYAQEQVLDGTPAAAHKVALVDAVRRTLKNGLWVLGIPAPEKM